MRNRFLFYFLIVLVMACPVKGQVKKQLTEADYKLWSTLEINQLSEKGNWVSYSLYNETAGDTLFVRNTTNLKTFAFPGSAGGKFAADNAFVVRANNGDVLLKNLNNGSEQRFSNIGNYSVTLGGKFVIMHRKDESVSGDLLVVGTDGTELLKLPNVSLYTLNPDRTQLVCDSGKKLHLVNLKKIQPVKVIDTVEREYTRFVWQNNGLSFGWCSGKDMVAVGLYRIRDGKSYTFDRSKFGDFPVNGVIANPDGLELKISDDGARIFFNVMVIKPATDSTGVQIWNTADKMLYAARAAFNNISDVLKLAVWFPDAEKFRMVTNDRYPRIIQIPGQSYALVYNPLDNEPQFDSDAPINYYLQNITTGQQDLLLSDQSANVKTLEISKNGKYIAYFRNNHWCLYDIKSGMHRNLTAKISGEFTHEKYDRSGEKAVCGIAGWTENGSEVMIYDSYDIWLFKTDGTKAVRLTNGREHNVVYRIVSKSPHGLIGSDFNSTLNLAEGLLLRAVSDTKNGYYNYSLKYGLQEMVYENNRIDSIKQSENGAFCYLTEHYHLAPQLIFKPKNQKSIMLYESNRHQKNYEWGFSKLISYENSQGKPLLGALFYPAGYDADKKYPMIVHIYERQSDQFNQYVNPTLHNADGFNVTNYTTQGYFVLLPDIAYTDGKTGSSALDCVSAAVNEVLAHESIDADRLGLVGHSFGGYETNFIVTQTNKFAAAISGAGVSDIVSSYLTVGSANKKPDGWRYEFNQFRIGASLFDSYETYIQNSPITFAKQISTPLLLWSGENDTSINYSQSLEMHLALRRLQKPNIFLLYEQGGHSLMKKDDQIDLTYRMQDWFNFYLKDGIRPTWFKTDKL